MGDGRRTKLKDIQYNNERRFGVFPSRFSIWRGFSRNARSENLLEKVAGERELSLEKFAKMRQYSLEKFAKSGELSLDFFLLCGKGTVAVGLIGRWKCLFEWTSEGGAGCGYRVTGRPFRGEGWLWWLTWSRG